jgi:hypothetical protein
MGRDLHLFCETMAPNGSFQALSDGEFYVPRSHELLRALGVGPVGDDSACVIRARGIPFNVSQEVSSRFYVPVVDTERAKTWQIGEHFSPEAARELVCAGLSAWIPEAQTRPLVPSSGGYISHPDWHGGHWLTLTEFRDALRHAEFAFTTSPWEIRSLLCYLEAVESTSGRMVRLVFWFDN